MARAEASVVRTPSSRETAPVLAVFLDGLGADAAARMPFLSSQPTVRRMHTELGYSVTCHASMYTGVRPDRHGLWFIWQRRPQTSPFRWMRPFRFLDRIDNLPMHVLATKISRRFTRTSSWFGIPYPVHVRWRDIPDLDVAERKLWPEPHYLETAPTIFDLMQAGGIRVEIVGMNRKPPRGLSAWRTWQPSANPARFTFLFAGDVDHESHALGQDSPQVTSLVKQVDELIEDRYVRMAASGARPRLVVWSDHGHHDVRPLNPLAFFKDRGFELRRYPHVIDTNFIRFWIDDVEERARCVNALDELGIGHVLTADELTQYRVDMRDDRYGNVIFYVDLPWALSHTIWGFGRRLASAHGYLPSYPKSDAVFVSSEPAREGPLDLVDVAPSLATLLDLPVPADLDGSSVFTSEAATG